MKKYLILAISFILPLALLAQIDQTKYPDLEFPNEVCSYSKDSFTVARLEKSNSKMDTKIKMMGMGGAENGYTFEGERSTVRFSSGKGLSFIYSTGPVSSTSSSAYNDSMMRANGLDPSMLSNMGGGSDPSQTITLYKATPEKGFRKIYMMKTGGMFSMGKNKSSDKYTFSVKKIREGYWELIIDKSLPKGEYAFTMMGGGMGSMDGSTLIFAFAVD